MFPVALQDPVSGLYSSAVAAPPQRALGGLVLSMPPATSTWPLGSSVAVAKVCGVAIFPVAVQVPGLGSYSSADVVSAGEEEAAPPPSCAAGSPWRSSAA